MITDDGNVCRGKCWPMVQPLIDENAKLKEHVAELKRLYPQLAEANQTVRRLMGKLEDSTITERELRERLRVRERHIPRRMAMG